MNVNNMKRIYLVFLICFCASYSFAQEKEDKIFYYDTDWNKISSKKDAAYARLITFYENDFHHPVGLVKDYYLASGSLQWEGKFSYYDIENEKNNREQGRVIWYYENGKKSRQSQFNDGDLYGVTKYWHENGEIESSYEYDNGKLDGEISYYNNKGILSKTVDYNSGKAHGFITYYYTRGLNKGNPKWTKEYINGEQTSKWALEFDEYGSCAFVAEEKFYNNNNDWSLGYNSDNSCSYSIDTVNQNYSITTHEDGLRFPALINVDVNPVSEYVIDASIKLEKGKRYSILFGFKDWDNYMSFDIYEDEDVKFKINKTEDGVNKPILEEYQKLEAPYSRRDFNRIQIRQLYDEEEGKIKFLYVINKESLGTTSAHLVKGFNFGFSVSGGSSKLTADYIKLKYPCGKDIIQSLKPSCSQYGSGFAINAEGYIATNYHVVKECENVSVVNVYGDTISVSVVARDSVNDLAILKAKRWLGELPFAFPDREAEVFEKVYAYGYPRIKATGANMKATSGDITAKMSNTETTKEDERFYQHTAPIMGGNSGGPLFNADGDVIGVNTLAAGALENVAASLKTRYLTRLMRDNNISSSSRNTLKGKNPSEQYKLIKNYIYLILVKD